MPNILIPENHHFFSVTNEVTQICNPLFKTYAINGFYYLRVFDDNTGYILMSHREYLEYHAKQDYPVSPPISNKLLTDKFSFLGLPDQINKSFNPVYNAARNFFDLDYPFYMVERYNNYYDTYTFTSSCKNHSILNFYLNYRDILENFKFYFLEKASQLIKIAACHKVSIPDPLRPTFGGLKKTPSEVKNFKQQFLNKIPVEHYVVNHLEQKVAFTKKEIESLKLLNMGHTAKEISERMFLSPRTIEEHLEHIKHKLGVKKKSEIIAKIIQLNVPLQML